MRIRDVAVSRGARWIVAVGVVAFLAAAPRASFGAGAITSKNVAQKLAAAKTKADYKALAAYFHAKAAQAGKEATEHQKMLDSVSGKPLESWGQNVPELIESYQKMEKSYEKAATELDIAAQNAPK